MARSRLSAQSLQAQMKSGSRAPAGEPPAARGRQDPAQAAAVHKGATHEVRIIGGQWKRRRLKVSNLPGLRPTADRVRETLFNWLAHQAGGDLTGWRCLDAFAGTGALGLEAASRGAAAVTLVESQKDAVRHLQAAVHTLQASTVRVVQGDGLSALRQHTAGSLHLVFLDPPFASDAALYEATLKAAETALADTGLIYLEAGQEWPAERLAEWGLQRLRHLKAGQVHAHLLARAPVA
ncbi:16S rRNA (guanine(966)-N(2))-methyltransferase RsmD [Comamonas serinivorans]|uniref:16S rRNA (Guanine(966)-N(2))-methyltransferase RsmD n=1 Tax=Comamonas serinivorans TaxID=1082851 RepID=A0A1Y0ERU3_9BURK|nr:16S rRNA (guanine(966)-N(2))-methyltransferase RsmD [Comamonas serinivorans]ARU05972.1 16S rRNA (guanine(966)-N(2))-methyltransferase RsmD [Comamonas serinivorans]